MTACLEFLDGTQTFSLSAENTKPTEVDPSSHRRGQRGGGQTGVLLREIGNRCFILQVPSQRSSPVRRKWYRLKGGAFDTPTPLPVPHSVVQKMETHPIQRDNLCERQVLAAWCRDSCPHWIQAGTVFMPKFLVCAHPTLTSHIQMPATRRAQNLTKPSTQVDVLWSSG